MRDDLQYDFEWIVCPHTHTHTQPLQDGYVPLMPLFVGLLLLLLFVFAFQPSPRAWLTPRWQLHVGSQIQGPLMSIKTRVTINHGLLLLFQISSCYHLFSIFIFLLLLFVTFSFCHGLVDGVWDNTETSRVVFLTLCEVQKVSSGDPSSFSGPFRTQWS